MSEQAPMAGFDALREAARVGLASADPQAVQHHRALVSAEPTVATWRLRLADALQSDGRADEADSLRAELMDAALASGHPLVALAAAVDRHVPDLGGTFRGYLVGSTRLGRPAPPPPPGVGGGPPEVPAEIPAEIPGWPHPPRTADLPPMPLLSLLDEAALNHLTQALGRRSLAPGERLLAEGTHGEALYLVVEGALEVVKEDPARGEVALARLGPGALVGEMGLMLDRARSATVRAVDDVEAIRIELDALRGAADHNPMIEVVLGDFTWQRLSAMWLDTSPVLRDLPEEARRALLTRLTRQEAMDGELLVEQGEAVGALWLLIDGRVKVLCADAGEISTVAELGPGQVFGEIGLLTGAPATATVEATAECTLARLAAEDFEAVRRAHPALSAALESLRDARVAENRFIFEDDEFFEDAD
jgi:CRP-like cAMP-binding protein